MPLRGHAGGSRFSGEGLVIHVELAWVPGTAPGERPGEDWKSVGSPELGDRAALVTSEFDSVDRAETSKSVDIAASYHRPCSEAIRRLWWTALAPPGSWRKGPGDPPENWSGLPGVLR